MNIFILASLPDSLTRFRGKLLLSLIKNCAQVHVSAPDLSKDTATTLAMKQAGIYCHDIAMTRTGVHPAQDIFTLFTLIQLLHRVKPTHFLAYTIKPVVYGIALITGQGYAFNNQAHAHFSVIPHIMRWIYKIALTHATCVIFQNPDDQALFIQRGLVQHAV